MKNYLGYIRVSTPKQGRGVSLDEQRAAILAFAERRGLVVTDWYVETETAAKQGRTQYARMLKELESGNAAGVIIHKIDRSARNMKDWANLGELIDSGIDVQFAHESLDLHSRGGRLAADIQAVVAADYIRNLRDEVLKGFYGRLKQGFYPLKAPIGYRDCGGGIPKAIDPVKGPLVRYAFERYAKGDISLADLSADLFARGLKNRGGTSITRDGMSTMLHNRFYLGIIDIKRRGEVFQGAHEPIVTKKLYDQVQDVLMGHHIPKSRRHVFLYRGLVAHVGCNRHLTGERVKGRFVYYRCHGENCRKVAISEENLDKAINEVLGGTVLQPEELKDFRDIMEAARTGRKEDAARDEQNIRIQIEGCVDRITRLTDAYLDGAIPKETYESRHGRLFAEKRGFEDRLALLQGEPEWYKQCVEFELWNSQVLGCAGLSGDEKRDVLRTACLNLGLEGKEPVIELRSPYREINNVLSVSLGGPRPGDVRNRSRRVLEIIRSIPQPANDNYPIVRTKSLKS